MRPALLLGVLVLCACRPPTTVARESPVDFDALPGSSSFSEEATLLDRWPASLRAQYEGGEAVSVTGVDGIEVRGVVHRVADSKGAVVLLAGRTEPIRKYAELIEDLNGAGFSTYAMDVRGQGASGRMLPNPQKSYVLHFDDYATDVDTFVTQVVRKDTPKKVFIVAHSMGGAVAALYADTHQAELDGLVLNAPMLDINTGSFPPSVAFSLGAEVCSATDGTAYALGYSDYEEETDFSKATVTSSEPRWRWKKVLFREQPELIVAGVTWRWLCESLTASSHAQALGRFSAVPTLLLQAENDTVVKPGGQNRYCGDAPRCQLEVIEGGRHELLQERDELRNKAVSRIVKFLSREAAR